jgi:hypothetical protein
MAAMSTPCTNCQYLALHSSVCENPTHFSFLLQNEKEEENHGSETKLGKNLDQEIWVF